LVCWVIFALLHLPCPVMHAHQPEQHTDYVEHVHDFHHDHDETEGDYHWHWVFPEQQSYLQSSGSTTAQLTLLVQVPTTFEFSLVTSNYSVISLICRSVHANDRCRAFFTDIFAARCAATVFCKFQC
jgi:hypothetical protein